MQLFGMRQTAVAEPKLLIEAFGINNKRVAFPLTDRAAVIQRVVGIAAKLTLLGPSVRVDNSVVSIAAADKDENTLPVPVLIELDAVRQLVLTRAAWRHAEQEHGIVFQEIAL